MTLRSDSLRSFVLGRVHLGELLLGGVVRAGDVFPSAASGVGLDFIHFPVSVKLALDTFDVDFEGVAFLVAFLKLGILLRGELPLFSGHFGEDGVGAIECGFALGAFFFEGNRERHGILRLAPTVPAICGSPKAKARAVSKVFNLANSPCLSRQCLGSASHVSRVVVSAPFIGVVVGSGFSIHQLYRLGYSPQWFRLQTHYMLNSARRWRICCGLNSAVLGGVCLPCHVRSSRTATLVSG